MQKINQSFARMLPIIPSTAFIRLLLYGYQAREASCPKKGETIPRIYEGIN